MMLKVTGYAVLLIVWGIVRIRLMIRRREPMEAIVNGGILLICLAIGTLIVAKVPVPSFNAPVEFVFQQVGKQLLGR
jgi:hypothetical protein